MSLHYQRATRTPHAALRILLLALLWLAGNSRSPLPSLHAQTPPARDNRFGVIESYENVDAATDLSVAWTRVRFQWAEVQAGGPNTWTPTVSDAQIEAELAAGREVIGLLIGIPDWARDPNRLPQGLWLPHDDPGNTWAIFVREVVGRWHGRITHWIIWNEPDIAATEIAHTWDGSVADFAQLQRVAYLAAHNANPDAIIHLSAFTYWADVYAGTEQYMARLLDELLADPEAAAHNAYFDVATAHLYFQPIQIYDLLIFFQEIMRTRGLTQPIWLVETNAPPMDDPTWPVPDPTLRVTLREQAAFVPQALAAAIAAGAERIALFKLQDTEDDRAANPEPFGLVRDNGERRPAFGTYHTALQYLAGATGGEVERLDRIGQIRVDQPDRTTTVLFNRLFFDQEAVISAAAPNALLVTMTGVTQTITATHNVYTITLPASSCSQPIGDYCMIGGPTYYLVQARQAGELPTLPVPLPTVTPTPTATPTATATPTVTPSPTITAAPTATPSPTVTPAPTVTTLPTFTPRAATAAPAGDAPVTLPPPGANRNAIINGLLLTSGLSCGLGVGWWLYRRRRAQN
ncbi:MAG: hypothetical protein IAE79_06400 [Anaerolinea sp.]|nr:hypothetical protein [Anaerolinea sp.]